MDNLLYFRSLGRKWVLSGKTFLLLMPISRNRLSIQVDTVRFFVVSQKVCFFGPAQNGGYRIKQKIRGSADEYEAAGHAPVVHLELTEIGPRSHLSPKGVGSVPLNRVLPHALTG